MRNILWIIGFFLMSFGTQAAMRAEYRLMILGDSLSAGYNLPAGDSYGTQLQSALIKAGYTNVTIINNSKTGETTNGAIARLASAIDERPDGVIIELGINDALRGAKISDIQKNLEKIIQTFKTNSIPVMLIGMQIPTRGGVYNQQFIQMYKDLAAKYDLYFYPFFMKDVLKINLVQMTFDQTLLQGDGAHPTQKGVTVMVDNTLPTLIAFLKKQGVRK